MNRVLCAIIGSNGYIGRHLAFHLKSKGIDFKCYDINGDKSETFTRVDLSEKCDLEKINLDVDYIYFFAGLTGTYSGFDNYEYFIDNNEKILLHLLDMIRKTEKRPRIVFPSSRLVYKGNENDPIKENDPKEGRTIYAINKNACEMILAAYNNAFDIPYTVYRICIPYGDLLSSGYSYGTIGFFVKQAIQEKNITLYGDGNIKRTFTHISDICNILVECSLLENSKNETFNIGGESLSLKKAATLVAKKYNANISFIPWPKKDLFIESGSTVFDDSKLQSLLCGYRYYKLSEEFEYPEFTQQVRSEVS